MAPLQAQGQYLCVGGPLDGKMMAATSPNGFRVPVNVSRIADNVMSMTPIVREVSYRAETFATEAGDVYLWVPVGQTPLETMMRLCANYRPEVSRGDNS